MRAGLFGIGLAFDGGFILVAAVGFVVALLVLALWFVLRPDPPERPRDNESGDGW